jgi:hypothetical protein
MNEILHRWFSTLINRSELSVFGSKPSKLDYALKKQIIISLMSRILLLWSARCNLKNACIKGKHMNGDISPMLHNGPKTSSVVICDLTHWSWSLRAFGSLMGNVSMLFDCSTNFSLSSIETSREISTSHTSHIISCLPNTICTFYTWTSLNSNMLVVSRTIGRSVENREFRSQSRTKICYGMF